MSHCIDVVFLSCVYRNTRGYLPVLMIRQFVSGTGSLVAASGESYD